MEPIQEKLTKEQLIATMTTFIQSEEVWEKQAAVKEWKTQYRTLIKEDEETQRKAFDALEEEDDVFEFKKDPLDETWKALQDSFKEKIAAKKKAKTEEEKQNLIVKEDLVTQLKQLVEEEMQNVGTAFTTFYAIRDKWNEVGQVNKSKFKQLQYDYSHFRDLFYYNVGIHDQLKNYDFKKNEAQKQEIIDALKAVVEQDSIKKMEKTVKELQAKWDELGPASNEAWEKLKADYWDTVNAIYEKIKVHYKALRETQAVILEEKNVLIERIGTVVEEIKAYKTPKEWVAVSEKVNTLHAEWKGAGFLGKQKEDAIWKQFKEASDIIRKEKNAFFDVLKKNNSKVVEAKQKLIEKAESLQDSKDWKKTTEELISLQKRWKASGQAQRNVDQKLWEKFRAACDTFFTAKSTYFDTLDDRQEANFEAKEAVCKKIASCKSEEELRSLIGEWQAIDFVPKKKITTAENSFNSAVKAAAKGLNIQEDALNMLQFEAKLKAIKEDENAAVKLKSERDFVQTRMDEIKEEIHRFEENMGFFGHSKGSQKLKEVVEKRMQEATEKLAEWQDKMKMLR